MEISKIIEEILNEASKGKILIGDKSKGFWIFYARFYAKIEGVTNAKNNKYPIFEFPDFDSFISQIEKYLSVAKNFYHEDKEYFDLNDDAFSKKLIFDLFVNATNFDLINFNNYIKKQTDLIKNELDLSEKQIGEFQGLKVFGKFVKNHSNLEAPYKFECCFGDGDQKFYLPSIYFGFGEDENYIMAVQNQHGKQNNDLSKKLDRFFRKVNKDVQENDVISQVSPNALVALTIFLAEAKRRGRENFVAPCFRPVRYHATKIAGLNKTDDKFEKHSFDEKHDHDQFNITNKFMYLMLRFGHHFSGADVEFDETAEQMQISTKNLTANENDKNIIQSIFKIVQNKNIYENQKDLN